MIEDDNSKLEKILLQDWFEEVIHQVYRVGDTEILDNALEEISFLLNVEIPDSKMKLQKIPNRKPNE